MLLITYPKMISNNSKMEGRRYKRQYRISERRYGRQKIQIRDAADGHLNNGVVKGVTYDRHIEFNQKI